MKLTINMRLLAQSQQMSPVDRLKAQSFATWLLKVREGRDDTVPVTKLPPDMSRFKYDNSLTYL